ncbi:hypothetical protein ABR738_00255 [Streptomyces sp. Edi4]|uniref:hypothetical protein n=1 Tax=Streptomyces sp. Edi4 TaxID=3162527 RepID=UPI003305AFC4
MTERRFTDARQLATAITTAATAIGPATTTAIRHEAMVLQALIQASASGRPGPNVITGAYRASWQVDVRTRRGGATATVGTFAPQARRLELGFTGTDARGRAYAQPPFPHVAPALAQIQQNFAERIGRAVLEAL